MTDFRNVSLPESLCAAAEEKFGQSFGGLQEFLIFVLREMLNEQAGSMDEAEQRLVEQRLRELGYL
jgi:hypothetical protein